LHTIVSSCFVGQDAPQFAMGVFVDAPELQLQSQAELERCFILTQRFQTFSAKETKCEQCYRPGAQRQSIFLCGPAVNDRLQQKQCRSWFLGVWTLHPLHLRSMTIQLEKAFDMTRHAALNTSFVGLEQNDRMNWPEVENEKESGNLQGCFSDQGARSSSQRQGFRDLAVRWRPLRGARGRVLSCSHNGVGPAGLDLTPFDPALSCRGDWWMPIKSHSLLDCNKCL
jgi:hypothetical protein